MCWRAATIGHFALLLASLFPLPSATSADDPAEAVLSGEAAVPFATGGRFDFPREVAAGPGHGWMVFGDGESIDYRVTMEILAWSAGMTDIRIFPEDPQDFNKPAALRITLNRDAAGRSILAQVHHFNREAEKWERDASAAYLYRPTNPRAVDRLHEDKIETDSWRGRWLTLQVNVTRRAAEVWFEGMLVHGVPTPEPGKGSVAVQHFMNDRVRNVHVEAYDPDPILQPVDLSRLANGRFQKGLVQQTLDAGGFSFNAPDRINHFVDLQKAQWVDQRRDPQSYYEFYDGGPYFLGDPRMPFLRVPKADYIAVHLLAVARDDPELTNKLTLRTGRFGYAGQVIRRDYVGEVPRASQADQVDASCKLDTVSGPLFYVRVPMTETVAQDIEADFLEMEITKELSLARHVPDPNRFRKRPLGPPSGVQLVAMILERCPLQMTVTSDEPGHAFVEPQGPVFHVDLANITDQPQAYRLEVRTRHLHGQQIAAGPWEGSVGAGETRRVDLRLTRPTCGYYDIEVFLKDQEGGTLLKRVTSFAQLPPDARQHRDRSPFGSWNWNGGHFTSKDHEAMCRLYRKIGFRYGVASGTLESRQQWGVRPGFEPRLDPELKALKQAHERTPDVPNTGLIFHENSISGPHVTRVPDLFHSHPPYELSDQEEQRYREMLQNAIDSGKAAREAYPDLQIKFGNGPLPTKELFYRRGFPGELFDSGGNEPGAFHRLPENQPPDYVSHNASIWMDRQLLDAYGYGDKPVRHCYEVCYPGDNPGNHSSATQADYFVRHALHSLAWEQPFIHIGMMLDVGNSYYFSNWGASGFCRAYPEMNVKPAYVALATMTSVLDGATFVEDLDLGSPSLYGLRFERPDGKQVVAYWTIRGQRPIAFHLPEGSWTHVDDSHNEREVVGKGIALTATPTVNYLVGTGKITRVEAGEPTYDDPPEGDFRLIAELASLDGWTVESEASAELEAYNMMAPRRKGRFRFEANEGAIRITPEPLDYGKATMPMYEVLTHEAGLELPGRPDEIRLWINGNSGWGRVIFELTDASGQRWISLGAAAAGENRWLLDWLPPDMMKQVGTPQVNDWNTNDPYGVSRINFDGWRDVAFPLPGNYPFENHPWPDNSNWKWDGDGVVKYPLTLRKLVIEIPEKVLHVKTFAPVPRPWIEIKQLRVGRRQ